MGVLAAISACRKFESPDHPLGLACTGSAGEARDHSTPSIFPPQSVDKISHYAGSSVLEVVLAVIAIRLNA